MLFIRHSFDLYSFILSFDKTFNKSWNTFFVVKHWFQVNGIIQPFATFEDEINRILEIFSFNGHWILLRLMWRGRIVADSTGDWQYD